jgi:mannosyl-oligosaccharide alpha-1,2-mannosidase
LTLLLGLRNHFERAPADVAQINFVLHHMSGAASLASAASKSMPQNQHAAFFETIIRYLGGFLPAYALTKEPIPLARADELGEKLLPAFTTPSGLPVWGVNTQTWLSFYLIPVVYIPYSFSFRAEVTESETILFAEITSCQLEYKYLAHVTGREIYFTTVR